MSDCDQEEMGLRDKKQTYKFKKLHVCPWIFYTVLFKFD